MQRHKMQNSLDLAYYLVKNIGIATVPGSSFYSVPSYGQFQIRFCFCKNPQTLQQAKLYLDKIRKTAGSG